MIIERFQFGMHYSHSGGDDAADKSDTTEEKRDCMSMKNWNDEGEYLEAMCNVHGQKEAFRTNKLQKINLQIH